MSAFVELADLWCDVKFTPDTVEGMLAAGWHPGMFQTISDLSGHRSTQQGAFDQVLRAVGMHRGSTTLCEAMVQAVWNGNQKGLNAPVMLDWLAVLVGVEDRTTAEMLYPSHVSGGEGLIWSWHRAAGLLAPLACAAGLTRPEVAHRARRGRLVDRELRMLAGLRGYPAYLVNPPAA
jgi:hypothetical protein